MIKKLVYGLAIIAGLVSCNDDYTDWASPQSNDSKEPVDKIAFTVEPAVSAIDFVVETAENIQLFTTSLQDGQVSEYALTLSAEGKDKTAALSATAAGMVASTDLANAVAAIYGKSPEERTVAVEVAADVTVKTEDGSVITKKKASPFTLKVKLNTPLEYFLVGDVTSWADKSAKCMLYPQGDKKYAYTTDFTKTENGVQTAGNLKIWLGADIGNWDNCYGAESDGDNTVSGKLVSVNAGAIACPEVGKFYKLEVDFSTNEYAWAELTDQAPKSYTHISLIGEYNDWDTAGSEKDLEQITPHNWYIAGFEPGKDGKLKLRADHKWDISWGAATDNVTIADKNYLSLTTTNSKDIIVPNGKYNVFFNDITGEVVFQTAE